MIKPGPKSPSSTDIHVGRQLRMRRLMLGVTQEKLADQVGLTFQQVQKYETGKNRISASRLQQFANILGVPISFFFEIAPNDKPSWPDYASRFLATSNGLALASAFMKIKNRTLRRSIADLVAELDKTGF